MDANESTTVVGMPAIPRNALLAASSRLPYNYLTTSLGNTQADQRIVIEALWAGHSELDALWAGHSELDRLKM